MYYYYLVSVYIDPLGEISVSFGRVKYLSLLLNNCYAYPHTENDFHPSCHLTSTLSAPEVLLRSLLRSLAGHLLKHCSTYSLRFFTIEKFCNFIRKFSKHVHTNALNEKL